MRQRSCDPKRRWLTGACTAAAASAVLVTATGPGVGRALAGAAKEGASGAGLERGKYLVHHVAMCVQCHSPRNEQGELDDTRLLQGAPIPVPAPFPDMPWAVQAPDIAGLAGLSDEEEISVLTTGARTTGESPRPPMPPFRMTREDAAAVVAYLKSLAKERGAKP